MTALALAFLLTSGCGEKSASSKTEAAVNTTDPQWVKQDPQHKAKIAVVFVHGIFGDTLTTWSVGAGKKSFFDYLAQASQVGQNVDIFAFGFTSKMFGSGSLNINEAANKLIESLQFNGVSDYQSVVFVAHSMGGLVVMRTLISSPEFAKRVPLVVFYATPQEGSHLAALGRHFSANQGLVQMLPADGNGFLQQLSDDWGRLPARPPVACGYEKVEIGGELVVPWSSSTRYCTDTPLAIDDTDHLSIVKPDRDAHGSVVLLVNAMNRHVIGRNFGARLEMPDFTREADHYVFAMDSDQRTVRLMNLGLTKMRYWIQEKSDDKFFITPEDTPRYIGGEETQRLTLSLLAGAEAAEYRFRLRSDLPSEDVVVVRVPDIEAIRKGRSQRVSAVVRDLNTQVAEGLLSSLPEGDSRAQELAAKAAFDSVAKQNPGMSPSATWLVTADLLAGANWPQLAITALRRSEAESLETANSPSGQAVAAAVAAQSGESKVYLRAQTPPPPAIAPKSSLWLQSDSDREQSMELAGRLKGYKSLRAFGYSLEGDVQQAEGKKDAALKAYGYAAAIDRTPSVLQRMETANGMEGLPKLSDRPLDPQTRMPVSRP